MAYASMAGCTAGSVTQARDAEVRLRPSPPVVMDMKHGLQAAVVVKGASYGHSEGSWAAGRTAQAPCPRDRDGDVWQFLPVSDVWCSVGGTGRFARTTSKPKPSIGWRQLAASSWPWEFSCWPSGDGAELGRFAHRARAPRRRRIARFRLCIISAKPSADPGRMRTPCKCPTTIIRAHGHLQGVHDWQVIPVPDEGVAGLSRPLGLLYVRACPRGLSVEAKDVRLESAAPDLAIASGEHCWPVGSESKDLRPWERGAGACD